MMKRVSVYYLNIEKLRVKEAYLFSVLPEKRVKKALGFVRQSDRLLSLAAGYLIDRVIGDYETDEYGKPRAKDCFFSVSHSGALAVLAVSAEREVGIDLEAIRDDDEEESLAGFCFDTREQAAYRAGTPFWALFTAKESLSKAVGCGLLDDVKTIPALPLEGAVAYKKKVYFRHALDLDGCFASVTLEGEDFTIETEEVYVR